MSLEQIGKNSTDGCVVPGQHIETNASGSAPRTLTAAESGGVFFWDVATGVDYTLPTPVAGMRFSFYATVSVTSNAHAISTSSASVFIGGALQQVIAASGTSEGQVGDDASDVTISQNGSTTGGLEGTWISVLATSTTTWVATGISVGSGTLATPFA